MLYNSGESGHPCLVLDLRGNAFSFSLLRMVLAVSLSSVQLLGHVRLFVTPWTAACWAVHPQLPELAQTHVHQVGDAIQPSHPRSSPSPAFNLSQHQGLFQ